MIISGDIASVHTVAELRAAVDAWRAATARIALVPTMGALHQGHLALLKEARARADKVVVSIFVNPAQFAPQEDFARYPRDLAKDRAMLAAQGATDLIYAPEASEIYPDGFATRVVVDGPGRGLESDFRPHFFGGVATVVGKLFTQCRPDIAVFGQKDYQQLKVVTRMAADLDLGVKIVGVPTVRERDGLAMSSRNVYLSPEQRAVAPTLHRVMKETARRLRNGDDLKAVMTSGSRTIQDAGFALDYFEARHAETLAPVASIEDGPLRLLVAAKIGTTRLIDNIGV